MKANSAVASDIFRVLSYFTEDRFFSRTQAAGGYGCPLSSLLQFIALGEATFAREF